MTYEHFSMTSVSEIGIPNIKLLMYLIILSGLFNLEFVHKYVLGVQQLVHKYMLRCCSVSAYLCFKPFYSFYLKMCLDVVSLYINMFPGVVQLVHKYVLSVDQYVFRCCTQHSGPEARIGLTKMSPKRSTRSKNRTLCLKIKKKIVTFS